VVTELPISPVYNVKGKKTARNQLIPTKRKGKISITNQNHPEIKLYINKIN
jgi:hypothetical protein